QNSAVGQEMPFSAESVSLTGGLQVKPADPSRRPACCEAASREPGASPAAVATVTPSTMNGLARRMGGTLPKQLARTRILRADSLTTRAYILWVARRRDPLRV